MGPVALRNLASRRSRHLVFLAHVWACAPFLAFWLRDRRVREILGPETVGHLRWAVLGVLVYLAVRTVVAWREAERFPWEYVFCPLDVGVVTLVLTLSHRGPMSNLTLLYLLPMVAAAGSLNVRWALAVGAMVIAGTALSAYAALGAARPTAGVMTLEMLSEERLNVAFRLYFLLVLSSLMATQALYAADLRARAGVLADRARIALEMHDGVQGRLIALAQTLELVSVVAPRDGARAAELAGAGRAEARAAADELRFLVQRLRAPALEEGFAPAFRQYASNLADRAGLELEVGFSGDASALDPETENAVFRIAQEAMTNVAKHAGASRVRVAIAFGAPTVVVVEDDGRGVPPGAPEGVGLASLRARARGRLTLSPREGGGTTLRAEVG